MDRLGYGDTWEDGGTVSTGDDVEQFAALLRRLKDRTDRSYGSLARRLNMNTSTLTATARARRSRRTMPRWSAWPPSAERHQRNASNCTACGCSR